MEIYLDIKKDSFEKSLNDANKRAIERDGDEGKENALYEAVELISDGDMGFDSVNECVDFSGTLKFEGQDLGYISGSVPLDFEDIIAIIETYRKKLGKLKTVLEATKDENKEGKKDDKV